MRSSRLADYAAVPRRNRNCCPQGGPSKGSAWVGASLISAVRNTRYFTFQHRSVSSVQRASCHSTCIRAVRLFFSPRRETPISELPRQLRGKFVFTSIYRHAIWSPRGSVRELRRAEKLAVSRIDTPLPASLTCSTSRDASQNCSRACSTRLPSSDYWFVTPSDGNVAAVP
jgi:hypothetical protein